MTTSKKKTPLAKQDKQSKSEKFAKVSLSASYMNSILADSFTSTMLPKAELSDVAMALTDKITTIQDGDMKPIEAMLISQAHALQTMFVTLGRMAASKTQLAHYTAFMNMALKAQSQSRATIRALTELKYPKQVTFAKQANITTGNQQINNSNLRSSTRERAHVKEKTIQSNELLEKQNGEWLDTGATIKTIIKDSAMETMG